MRIAIDWPAKGREFAILVAIGTFLTFIGPFGSSASGDQWWRLWLFWTGVIVTGGIIGEFVSAVLKQLFAKLPMLVQLAVIALVMAVIMTPVVALFGMLIGDPFPLSYWPELFGGVFVISAFMTGIGVLMDKALSEEPEAKPDNPSDIQARFLMRLPPAFRAAKLHAVESEDHYLRVHTDKGSELILMRLADAVRELEGSGGLQTHRSWWVAGDAVKEVKRQNGRLVLVTHGDVDVPVSRTYAKLVREAGLS